MNNFINIKTKRFALIILILSNFLYSLQANANQTLDLIPTVIYQIKDAGPNNEDLNVSATVIPPETEDGFLRELLQKQQTSHQLTIIKKSNENIQALNFQTGENPNVTIVNYDTQITAAMKRFAETRLPSAEISGAKKAGIYVAITSVMGYGFTFYMSQGIGPATAGTFVAGALFYLMGVKPQVLWGYLNGGGHLATKVLSKNANLKLKAVTHESGKMAAGILFNVMLTSAFTISLKYPVLFQKFPTFVDFAEYVIPTAVASFGSKNMWDMAISKWRINPTNPVSDKTALLINYSKMLFLAVVSPLMYVQATRVEAMVTLGIFGALAVPGLFYENAYRNFAEKVISSVENSSAIKRIIGFSQKSVMLIAITNKKLQNMSFRKAPVVNGLSCKALF